MTCSNCTLWSSIESPHDRIRSKDCDACTHETQLKAQHLGPQITQKLQKSNFQHKSTLLTYICNHSRLPTTTLFYTFSIPIGSIRFPKNFKDLISNINLYCTHTHVTIQDHLLAHYPTLSQPLLAPLTILSIFISSKGYER